MDFFHESKCRTTQSLLPFSGYALICTGISLSSPLSSNALCFLLWLLLQTEDEDCLYHYYCLLAQLCARAKCDSQLECEYCIEWYAIPTRKHGTEMVELPECKCGTRKTGGKRQRVGPIFGGPLSAVRPPQLVCRVWVAGLRWTLSTWATRLRARHR